MEREETEKLEKEDQIITHFPAFFFFFASNTVSGLNMTS